jgi:hypothetical protein
MFHSDRVEVEMGIFVFALDAAQQRHSISREVNA